MCACLFAAVIGSVVFALLPPLVLAKSIDCLTAEQAFPLALALSYFCPSSINRSCRLSALRAF